MRSQLLKYVLRFSPLVSLLLFIFFFGIQYIPKVFATNDFTVSNIAFDPTTGALEFDYTGTSISGGGNIEIASVGGSTAYWATVQGTGFNTTNCTTSHCWARLTPINPDSGVSSVIITKGGLASQTLDYAFPLPTNYTLQNPSANGGWIPSGETWTYASADDPSFTFTVSGDKTSKYSPGMRVRLVQTSTKYFIITKVVYSSPNTTITVYGGTDYDLANASITNPYYSSDKAPQGFPLDPIKWTQEFSSTSNATQNSPTANTWYNPGSSSLDIPIGAWDVEYEVIGQVWNSTTRSLSMFVTLSTANNSESDSQMTAREYLQDGTNIIHNQYRRKNISLTSKTTYYLNAKVDQSGIFGIEFTGTNGATIIRATSAYL